MWRACLPALTGVVGQLLCKVDEREGEELKQSPPAKAFKYIWCVLYALLGLSWSRASSSTGADLSHAACVALLSLWVYVYACAKRKVAGAYVVACSIASVVLCISLHPDPLSKAALSPLLAWLLVAFHLNWDVI
jgi:tryptophan-rich sensory protein